MLWSSSIECIIFDREKACHLNAAVNLVRTEQGEAYVAAGSKCVLEVVV
jgi:hypothetical protein